MAEERRKARQRGGKEREEAVARRAAVGEAEAAGDCAGVVALMRAGPGDVEMQRAGCAALTNLAANNADNQVTIAEAGGIRSVVDAMERHKDVADVQEYGCATLSNLAHNGKKNIYIESIR